MSTLPLVLPAMAGLISVFFGIRYFRARQFMPYHAVVAGKAWARWAALTITAASLLPTLYVTVALRRFAPAVVVLALAVAGAGVSFFVWPVPGPEGGATEAATAGP